MIADAAGLVNPLTPGEYPSIHCRCASATQDACPEWTSREAEMKIEGLWELGYPLFISPGHSGSMSQSHRVS